MLGETFCRKRASLSIFAGVAFLLPGVVWLVQRRMGGVLPESWSHLCMYLPAGGAVLALVYTSHQRKTLPSKFFGFYGSMWPQRCAMSLALGCFHSGVCEEWLEFPLVEIASVVGWFWLLSEPKERRNEWGLSWSTHGSR